MQAVKKASTCARKHASNHTTALPAGWTSNCFEMKCECFWSGVSWVPMGVITEGVPKGFRGGSDEVPR
eukprot:1528720-Alexandrium_andersonii.AAC.1